MIKRLTKRILPYPATRAIVYRKCYRKWRSPGRRDLPGVNRALQCPEFAEFSQNGEDGLLAHIFSEIEFGNRRFLEFGFSAAESNSLRLVLREGFTGLFMDGSRLQCEVFNRLVERFALSGVKALQAFLTVENINRICEEQEIRGPIDLLSVDVDGNDYWIWEAITVLQPRVVIVEYNASLGPAKAETIPYQPDFDRTQHHPLGFYHGASLSALEALGKAKGYVLIGCDSSGVNAFFLHQEEKRRKIRPISASEGYAPHLSRINRGYSNEDQLRMIRDYEWEKV